MIYEESLDIQEKHRLAKTLRTATAGLFIDADVIIKSFQEVDYYKNFIGSVTREALKEGVTL